MENVRIQSNCLRGFFNRAFILAKHQENYSRRQSMGTLRRDKPVSKAGKLGLFDVSHGLDMELI